MESLRLSVYRTPYPGMEEKGPPPPALPIDNLAATADIKNKYNS